MGNRPGNEAMPALLRLYRTLYRSTRSDIIITSLAFSGTVCSVGLMLSRRYLRSNEAPCGSLTARTIAIGDDRDYGLRFQSSTSNRQSNRQSSMSFDSSNRQPIVNH